MAFSRDIITSLTSRAILLIRNQGIMNDAIAWKQDGIIAAGPVRPVKVCHRCGQDLKRQRRLRDERGYWCVACSKADKKTYRANHLPCDGCGCDVQRGKEHLLDDHRLCEVCWQKRQTEALREKMRDDAASLKQQRGEARRKSIRKWSIAAVELVVAGLLVIYVYPLASDPGPSADAQPAAATTRPQAAPQPGREWPERPVEQMAQR